MYPQQELCQDSHQACLGRVYGDGGGYPPYPWEQGNLCSEEGDDRKDLRDCERTAWIPLYTIHKESADGDECQAHFRMHELKEAGENPRQEKERRTVVSGSPTYFKEDVSQDKREVLESDSSTSLCLQSEVFKQGYRQEKTNLEIDCFLFISYGTPPIILGVEKEHLYQMAFFICKAVNLSGMFVNEHERPVPIHLSASLHKNVYILSAIVYKVSLMFI